MCQKYFIRPHHMLCMQFFEGKGYNDVFTEKMHQIKEELEKTNPQVILVAGTDMICANCPHRIGNGCKNEACIREHDTRVYNQVKDRVAIQASWQEITDAIYDNIINAGTMRETCGQCEWSDICFKESIE